MTRSRNNRRVVISDSESDDDDSNELIDNANFTERGSSHLGSNSKFKIDGVSESFHDDNLGDGSSMSNDDNSSDDDLGDAYIKADKDTLSAASTKREPENRNSTLRQNRTPNSNGGSRSVKRKANMWDINIRNIMSSSPRVSNQSSSECPGQRQLPIRGHKRPSYDMKHHPMDDILRPNLSAKRRVSRIEVPKNLRDSDSGTDKPRRSSRKTNQSTTPNYSRNWHPLDQVLRDNASSTRTHSKKSKKHSISELKDEGYSESEPNKDVTKGSESEDETAQTISGVRRSARVLSFKETPPNYDMKYHVMDSTLPPKAAAKRMKSKIQSAISIEKPSKSASSIKSHTEQLTTASRKSSTKRSLPPEPKLELESSDVPVAPPWSQLQNPTLNQTSIDWFEFQDLDRRVYLLQKGAPLHGRTITQNWTHVKEVLFDEGSITLDELRSREGTELLKRRYESIRHGLQNFFSSRPEPTDKKDWTLFKKERFDAYDMKPGGKYWKHERDSLVENGWADHVTGDDEGTTHNNSNSKRSPASKVGSERVSPIDLKEDGELDSITENENNLVESMRGVHPLSDAALEELLFPIEQYVMEESNLALESSTSFPTHRDKALDQVSTVAPEAEVTDVTDPDTLNRDLTGMITHDKEHSSSLGFEVNPRNEFGTPQILKVQNKAKKRKSRVDAPIIIHEDSPPQAKKIVRMKPSSPGADIPKENLDNLGSTIRVTLPSLFGGPLGSLSPDSSPMTG